VTPTVLLLVLGSALVHATWNLWAKQLGPQVRSVPLTWILTTLSSLIYAPVGLAMLAQGAWRPAPPALVWIAGSGVIHVAYFFLLLRGYRVGDLSLVYPVARGTGPLLAALGAIALFGEQPNALSIAGVLLVAAGVIVLTARRPSPEGRRLAPGLG